MTSNEQIAAEIIALERAALDRWGAGDPSGYLEISAADVTYFAPFLERRIDGLEALSAWYAPLRGTIHIDRYELVEPRVLVCGEAAVLTFRFRTAGRRRCAGTAPRCTARTRRAGASCRRTGRSRST